MVSSKEIKGSRITQTPASTHSLFPHNFLSTAPPTRRLRPLAVTLEEWAGYRRSGRVSFVLVGGWGRETPTHLSAARVPAKEP